VVTIAHSEYQLELNPSIYVLLSDHIYLATKHNSNDGKTDHPISSEIRLLYPNEYDFGGILVELPKTKYQIILSIHEFSYIALHFVNS
jgi:transcriptional antiterminator